MFKNLFYLLSIQTGLFIFFGCNDPELIHFYSEDKTQCVTVIDDTGFRYVIEGKHYEVPEKNYAKLNTNNIDPLSDILYICWRNQSYEWKVVASEAEIVDNYLDHTKFQISTEMPTDDRGIPSELEFVEGNCAIFSYYLMRLSPNKGGIVEIDD